MNGDHQRPAAGTDGSDRGQTLHDYLIGVSLMLLTLAAVFAMVPGLFQPFQEPVGDDEVAMAERVGDQLIETYSQPGSKNTVNLTRLDWALEDGGNFSAELERAGVPEDRRQVNVSLVRRAPDGTLDRHASGGSTYYQNTSVPAESIRVVHLDEPGRCTPTCRLVVRVWL